MATDLARLIVSLEAQNAIYLRKLEEATKANARFQQSTSSTLNKVKEAFAGLGALYAVGHIKEFIKSNLEAVATIGKVAANAGLGAEQFQRLSIAIHELSGATEGQVNIALNRFNTNLGKAREGSGKLQKAFAAAGVDIRQNTNVAIEQSITYLAGVEDESKRAALAAAIFGDRFGPKIAAALREGAKGFDEYREKLEGIFTDEQTKQAEEVNKVLEQTTRIFNKTVATTILENAQAIEAVAVGFGHMFGWMVQILARAHEFGDFMGRWIFRGEGLPPPIAPNHSGDPFNPYAGGDPYNPAGSGGLQANPFNVANNKRLLAQAGASSAGLANLETYAKVSKAIQDMFDKEHTAKVNAVKEDAAVAAARQKIADEAAASQLEAYNDTVRLAQQAEKEKIDAALEGAELQMEIDKENQDNYERLINEKDRIVKERVKEQGEAFADLFVQNLVEAADNGFDSILESWVRTLEQMALKAAALGIFNQLFPKGISSDQPGFAGFLGTIFGSHAAGGRMRAGEPGIVGEEGTELFVPDVSGTIIPHGEFGAFNFHATFVVGDIATKSQLVSGMSMAVAAAKRQVYEAQRRNR